MIVINLIELRGEILKRIDFLMPSCQTTEKEFLHAVDRAIAAESERDELKSKLEDSLEDAELKRELLADALNDLSIAESKLAELESKDEVGEMLYEEMQDAIDPYVNNGDLPRSVVHSWEMIFEHWVKTKAEPVQASEPVSQRITEQDVWEIFELYFKYVDTIGFCNLYNFNEWLNEEGRTLLAKLNEHREPVESIDSEMDMHGLADCCCGSSDRAWQVCPYHGVGTEYDILRLAREKEASTKVAPNKAEVPDGKILVDESLIRFLNGESHLEDSTGKYWFGEAPLTPGIYWWRRFLPSPPPLKGDTKMKCKGTNCSAENGSNHSLECISEHDALVYAGAGNRHPEARYRGYTGEPLKPNSSADEQAAWAEGGAARITPLKGDDK